MVWKAISAKYIHATGKTTTRHIYSRSQHKIQYALGKQILAVRVTLAKQVTTHWFLAPCQVERLIHAAYF